MRTDRDVHQRSYARAESNSSGYCTTECAFKFDNQKLENVRIQLEEAEYGGNERLSRTKD